MSAVAPGTPPFKQFSRTNLAEMRELTDGDTLDNLLLSPVSVSSEDAKMGRIDPLLFSRGFIARNPENHNDQWYVAKAYADVNFEEKHEVEDKEGLKLMYKILRYFDYQHLPNHLQAISKPFYDLAYLIAEREPVDIAERIVALRNLKNAKDAEVCAMLPQR